MANNDGEGSYYEDLKVEENTMSFNTTDMRQMELKRVKTSARRNATVRKTKSDFASEAKFENVDTMDSKQLTINDYE